MNHAQYFEDVKSRLKFAMIAEQRGTRQVSPFSLSSIGKRYTSCDPMRYELRIEDNCELTPVS